MTEEATPAPDNSSVNATINAVAGLAQAIPVYQDALQPAAKEVGKSLELVAKVMGIALAPLKSIVWGYDKIEGFINDRVGEKLKNVPPENIVTPPANIVGPAIEALKFSGEDVNLRELYANLIANAMDKETSSKTHPAFVEIIKALSSDEALIMRHFSTEICEPLIDVQMQDLTHSQQGYTVISPNHSLIGKKLGMTGGNIKYISSYLNNLCRLGLLQIPSGVILVNPGVYDAVEADYNAIKDKMDYNPRKVAFEYTRKLIEPTAFGKLFIETVVKEKE